jgi:hypothetical protein
MLVPALAQNERQEPASEAELAGITTRGRALAEYDRAAWHATDAFLAVSSAQDHEKAPSEKAPSYVARKDGDAWEVVFGKLNSTGDKFLIVFEARQADSPTSFTVKRYEPAKEASGFYVFAAKALALVKREFKGENRPYNKAILPADVGKFYVYVYPAQTKNGVWPLGGDFRYLVSADGATILERHQMHYSILEFQAAPEMKEVNSVFHTTVLDEVPEDTDVFLAMTFQPPVTHTIGTKHFMYGISPDGKVVFLMTMEAFKKLQPSKRPDESPVAPGSSKAVPKS